MKKITVALEMTVTVLAVTVIMLGGIFLILSKLFMEVGNGLYDSTNR